MNPDESDARHSNINDVGVTALSGSLEPNNMSAAKKEKAIAPTRDIPTDIAESFNISVKSDPLEELFLEKCFFAENLSVFI